jgi:archaellum component FlaC
VGQWGKSLILGIIKMSYLLPFAIRPQFKTSTKSIDSINSTESSVTVMKTPTVTLKELDEVEQKLEKVTNHYKTVAEDLVPVGMLNSNEPNVEIESVCNSPVKNISMTSNSQRPVGGTTTDQQQPLDSFMLTSDQTSRSMRLDEL